MVKCFYKNLSGKYSIQYDMINSMTAGCILMKYGYTVCR